jgi:glycosyltransferase involved in cell wall biosynthesis
MANLAAAEVIAVVSVPLADALTARGIAPGKIVVAPNGVDTARFAPSADGGAVRRRLRLGGLVIGFSGSFGRWHGAEILAEAFAILARRRQDATLLMIGDGETRPAAERVVTDAGLAQRARFVGAVAPADMPAHLAASDVLVSPQVPNPDGTPFFGSPTKLFEYMAMGRAVVASDLGQMAETIRDGKNGLLVPPGDANALADALDSLAGDAALRARIGAAAREESARHSWRGHAAAILAKLDERVPCA